MFTQIWTLVHSILAFHSLWYLFKPLEMLSRGFWNVEEHGIKQRYIKKITSGFVLQRASNWSRDPAPSYPKCRASKCTQGGECRFGNNWTKLCTIQQRSCVQVMLCVRCSKTKLSALGAYTDFIKSLCSNLSICPSSLASVTLNRPRSRELLGSDENTMGLE